MNLNPLPNQTASPTPQPSTTIKAGGGGSRLLLIIALILVLVVVGAYFFFSSRRQSDADLALETDYSPLDSSPVSAATDSSSSPLMDGSSMAGTNSSSSGATGGLSTPISGVDVNGLFIPSAMDTQAIEFLNSLEGQGEFPIKPDEAGLGKPNPFIQ